MREARVLLSKDDLAAGVKRVGGEISAAYPDGVLLVAVLKGSIPFLADIVRAVDAPVEVDFLAISKYAPDSGRARIVKDLDRDILGRDVVLVEDIIDTGLTLTYLLGVLGRREPRSLETCALLDKSVRRIVPTPLRFRAFEIADEFVLGYGLDFAERYRNLDGVFAGEIDALRDDPDAYVPQLYRR